MSCPFNQEALDRLKKFVEVCTANPDVLSTPDLSFFKNFIESFGGKVPTPSRMPMDADASPPEDESHATDADSGAESDLDLDMEGCIDPDTIDPSQKMGNPDKEVSEEDIEKADEKRSEAMSQFSQGNFDKALSAFNEAIELNPGSAILFARRAQVYLKLSKPMACIQDCSKALELNPDSATAYKFRGRAYRLLGEFEKAVQDLREACNIDCDEQSDQWLKEVTPNAKKIEQHRLKQERKQQEREERARQERARQAKEAHAKASAAAAAGGAPEASAPPPSGGAQPKMDDFYKLLQDPEIMAAFADPDVSAAFSDISSNPGNFYKYQSNPKVMALITKLSGKLSGSGMAPPFGGMGGASFPGFPGGFPGFGGAAPGGGAAPPQFTAPDDDNLD